MMLAMSSTTTTGLSAGLILGHDSAKPGCSSLAGTSSAATQRMSALSPLAGEASSSPSASAITVWNDQPPWSST